MLRRKVLIVGGTGRIGSALSEGLGFEYEIARTSRHATIDDASRDIYQIDVGGSADALSRLASGVDTIVALGATGHETGYDAIAYANLRGACNVFEAARRRGVRRVIFASTNHVYDGYRGKGIMVREDMPVAPGGLYPASKVFGEALAHAYAWSSGVSAICLRIGNFPANNRPTAKSVARWISARDMCDLVRRCIEVENTPYAVLNAVSENDERWLSLDAARDLVGYVPADNGSAILATLPPAEPMYRRRRAVTTQTVIPRPLPADDKWRVAVTGAPGRRAEALRRWPRRELRLVDLTDIDAAGEPGVLRQAVRDADAIVHCVPRLPDAEYDALAHHVARGAYHVLEAACAANVHRVVLLLDWSVFAGYTGDPWHLPPNAVARPVSLSGALHTFVRAMAHAYTLKRGLWVSALQCGDLGSPHWSADTLAATCDKAVQSADGPCAYFHALD